MKKILFLFVFLFLPFSLFGSNYSSSILLYLKAYQSDKRGDYEEAIALYESLLKLNPGSSEIRNDLASIHIKKSQFNKNELDKSEELLQKSIELNPSNRRSLMMLADIYAAKGVTYKAKALYEKCIELNSEDTEAYMFLGSLYATEKKYSDAITIYEKILAYDDDNITALYYTGLLNAELKEYDNAKRYFTKVLTLKPNFGQPRFLIWVTVYEMEGDYGKAIEYYQVLMAIDPTNRNARSRIANVFVKQKEYDKAISVYEELSGIDREDLSVRFEIGRLYLEQDRFDDAIREFSLILASKPNMNIVRYFLARTWKEKGDIKKALEEFLKIDPKSEEFIDALTQITLIHIKSVLIR